MFKIINIVDTVKKINIGVWNAATSTDEILYKKYGIVSELWFPAKDGEIDDSLKHSIGKKVNPLCIPKLKNDQKTIIVTHGSWRFPTRFGNHYSKLGFKWVYVPHGCLEPWSLDQKSMKKKIYYQFLEKPWANNANAIRAVGAPEYNNLVKLFENNVILIPNGVEIKPLISNKWDTKVFNFLFMARIHHKKGIKPLVEGWCNSMLKNNNCFKLNIAGPDQGELSSLMEIIKKQNCNNIEYVGAVYGEQKSKMLESSHYYILPSHSEGFPTSVLEAMQYGLIPIISEGCNFPEVFSKGLGFRTTPNENDITKSLNDILTISPDYAENLSIKNREFIGNNYALDKIADMQLSLYKDLLNLY